MRKLWTFVAVTILLSSCIMRHEKDIPIAVISEETEFNSGFKAVTAEWLPQQQYASDGNRVYEIIRWTSGDGNILISDFQTRTRVFLSSDLTLPSNDPGNTSLIESCSEGCSIFCTENYLYIIGRGSAHPSFTDKYAVSYLQQREKNGKITNIFELPSNVIFDESSVFISDGKVILFKARTYDYSDEEKVMYKDSLYIVDEKDFKVSELTTLPAIYGNMSMKSAYDNYIVFSGPAYNEEMQKYEDSIITIDLESGIFSSVYVADAYEQKMFCDDKVYFLNEETGSIDYIDLKTDSPRSTLKELDFGDVDRLSFTGDVFDKKLFLYTYESQNGVSKRFVFDPQSLELTEIDLYMPGKNKDINDRFVGPFAETSNHFFVIVGEKTVSFYDTAPDHVTRFLSERTDYEYAWIPKEDYYKSIPNYILVETRIEYR